MSQLFVMVHVRRLVCVLLTASIVACGGGGNGADPASNEIPIADRGFAASGIFAGVLDGSEVLLLLEEGQFFMLAGDIAAEGVYNINQVNLMGSGTVYKPTEEVQNQGSLTVTGEYRTDRHLDFTWRLGASGETRNLILEATPLYFDDSPIDRTLGTWINQDESNLIFFSISENNKPIAGRDYATGVAGETLSIAVLANDRDPDGDPIQISDVDERSVLGGDLSIDNRGTPDNFDDDVILYTLPDSFMAGNDSFSYTIKDVNDGTAEAVVSITAPARSVDLNLTLSASVVSPPAGSLLNLALEVSNPGDQDVRATVLLPLPSGLVYRDDNSAGDYDQATGFWDIELAAGATASLDVSVGVADFGNFEVSANIAAVDAQELNPVDDVASLTLTPTNLLSAPPTLPRAAQIEGILLSSLSQITGTITESSSLVNAYRIRIALGSGGLGGNSGPPNPYEGFVILSEEEVIPDEGNGEPELRNTMLILTTNPEGLFLNKLFFVSDEELQQ
ncbi:MAG: Ig-like domain-containing protein [Pseudomonadota bacterium]